MKKALLFFSLLAVAAVLAGCTFSFGTTSAATTSYLSTTSQTSTTQTTSLTTTSTSIDISAIESAVYERIYNELYDQVRAEVIQNISQDEFDSIYQQVMGTILDKIATGDITVSAQSVIDMIYQVVENQANAVVGVSNYDGSGTLLDIGSGVIYKHVGDTYYVVTNNHVVENGSSYEIRFADGSTVQATLRGVDTLVDVAVLYFTSTDTYQVAPFGDSENLQKGTIVLAVGNPSGYDFYGSVTMGIVSGTNRYFDINGDGTIDMLVDYIQHDASINAGNSGGALFNLQGEVIGINVSKIASVDIEGMGFAIPATLVSGICADIEQYGVSQQTPALGIEMLDIYSNSAGTFTYYGITLPSAFTAGVSHGFYVTNVTAGSSVDGYVQVGDIITQVGDIVVTNSTDFAQQFKKYIVGDVVDIVVYRNGAYLTLANITLKARVDG